MTGTEIQLTRVYNDERIEVSFDINDNVNIDEADVNEEREEDEENLPDVDITSFPTFSVKIIKPSNKKILEFSCSCNASNNEEIESEEDEQYELFRFDSVKVFKEGQENSIYEAETETMDGELYSKLMTTLLERGVDGVFVNSLIDLSTTAEHRHYVNLLQELQDFASGK